MSVRGGEGFGDFRGLNGSLHIGCIGGCGENIRRYAGAVSPAPPEDQDLKTVIRRLTDLQSRMNSLEQPAARADSALPAGVDAGLARQMVESQNLRDSMKGYELQQSRVYQDFIGGAGVFAKDIVEVLDKRFYPRLDVMFTNAKTAVTERMSLLTPERFADKTDGHLADFEARFETSILQFATLREEFALTEFKIFEATDRMDAIWNDQDANGIGGWRLVMRAVSAFVEKNKELQPPDPLGLFRGQEELRGPSQPAIPNFVCPRCHQEEVRRLYRNTIFQEALRVFWIAPYRCHACHKNFYRMRSPTTV